MRRGNGGIIGPQNRTTITSANGVWSLAEQQQAAGGRNWPGSPAATVPNAPVITSATSSTAGSATVTFTVGYDGGSTITGVTVTSYPGNISTTVTAASGTATLSGLTAGATYSFSVYATNSVGNSATNTSGTVQILSYYSLMMHMDGSNGSTTFTDSTGISTFAVDAGTPTISTTTSKFGGASFRGTLATAATQISTSNKAVFAPGTGPFTIECWVYSTSQSGYQAWFSTRSTTGYAQAIFFGLVGSQVTLFTSGALILSSMNLPTNTWTHVALSKPGGAGTTVYLYVGGAFAGQTGAVALDFSEQACSIGGTEYGGPGAYPFNGYIDELRMLKGVGAYTGTGSITVPTTTFPYPTI